MAVGVTSTPIALFFWNTFLYMSIDVIKKASDSLTSNISAHVWSNPIVGTESIVFADYNVYNIVEKPNMFFNENK